MNRFQSILNQSLFGVCEYIGAKLGVASSKIRLYFIYFSFLTLGSPIIFYMLAAFWLNVKRHLRGKGKVILE